MSRKVQDKIFKLNCSKSLEELAITEAFNTVESSILLGGEPQYLSEAEMYAPKIPFKGVIGIGGKKCAVEICAKISKPKEDWQVRYDFKIDERYKIADEVIDAWMEKMSDQLADRVLKWCNKSHSFVDMFDIELDDVGHPADGYNTNWVGATP